MPAGQEKGQTKAQMGGSLHNRPSTDWRSVPSAKRIGQPTQAEPMERSTPTKILRLAPDFVFVSFLCPPFYFFTLAVWHFSPSPYLFFSQALRGLLAHCSHILDAPPALIIPGGFFIRSLYKTGLMPKTCVMLPHEPFIHHYMHRYDLSFGQAGLPGSCAYPYVPVRSARW